MPLVRSLLVVSLSVIAGVSYAENCTVVKETCLQGPETRIIDGARVYRDCWQYETVTECSGDGTVNNCAPLESKSDCTQRNSECLKASKPGECELQQDSYACESPLPSISEGITEFPVESTVTDKFETDKYCPSAVDSSCNQTQMICTAPDETRVVDGVEVNLPCWEREFTYSCLINPENPSCGYLETAGCKPSPQKSQSETLTFDCKEDTVFTPHQDIQFVEKVNVLDAVNETLNTCKPLSCPVTSTTCLSYHPIFTDVCLIEESQLMCETGEKQTCDALTEKGCTLKETETETSSIYSCSTTVSPLPDNIQWTGSEEVITGMTEDSNCPFSDTLAKQSKSSCEISAKSCIEGAETRIVNGVPVYKDCWRYEVQYQCESSDGISTCSDLSANPKCELIDKKCMAGNDSNCSYWTFTYKCQETEDTVIEEERCTESICQHGLCTPTDDAPNTNLADTIAKLEVVRQAAVYGDYQNLRFFTGEMNTCRNKLGGVSCCKGKVKGSHSNASGLPVSYIFAGKIAKETIHTLGSPYVNDILMSNDTVASVMTKLYGEAAGQAYSPNLSYYGLTVSYVGGSVQFSFDPWTFFAMVALEVATDYLSCTPEEQTLQLKRGADTCRYVGSVCTEYILGQCMIKTESYCCYNSKLALLVQEAAHEQLGLGWNIGDSQVCQGLTAYEMSRVDLGKIDPNELGKLIDTSKVTVPDPKKTEIRAQARKEELEQSNKPYAPMPGKDGTCFGTDC